MDIWIGNYNSRVSCATENLTIFCLDSLTEILQTMVLIEQVLIDKSIMREIEKLN